MNPVLSISHGLITSRKLARFFYGAIGPTIGSKRHNTTDPTVTITTLLSAHSVSLQEANDYDWIN